MSKPLKKILSYICIVALCIGILPIDILAKSNVPRGIYINHFATSYYSVNMNWDIRIKDNNLTVTINDPNAEDDTSILLDCSCGYNDWEKINQQSGTLIHDLHSHKKGNYEITLYKANSASVSQVQSFVKYQLSITEEKSS